jgi:hypothetical protein
MKAVKDAGWWDVESNKARWLVENDKTGVVEGALRAWGYSKNTVRSLDLRREQIREQATDDVLFQSGAMAPEKWLENYRERRDRYAIAQSEVYSDSPGQAPKENPTVYDRYQETLRAATDRISGKQVVNWDKVDAFVGTLTAEEKKDLDEQVGYWAKASPVIQQYNKDVETIKNAKPADYPDWPGYFDIDEDVFQSWKASNSQLVEYFGDAPNEEAFFDQMYTRAVQEYQSENGMDLETASNNARWYVSQWQSKVQTPQAKWKQYYREYVPGLRETLQRWGMAGTGAKEVAKTNQARGY